MVAHTYNPSTKQAEERGLPRVQGQPGLHGEFNLTMYKKHYL